MLKNSEKYAALAALCMLTSLWACRRDEVPVAGKSPIELTAGVAGESPAVTKAVVTTGSGARALTHGTSLYMVMKSENGGDGTAPARYTRTIGYAQETATAASNTVKFASQYGRFWEDSYSRNSQLSVFSACVPGYYLQSSVYEGIIPDGALDATVWTVNESDRYDNTWDPGTDATLIAWPLRGASAGHQADDFVAAQDLCFSNNVSAAGDGRVIFDDQARKFGEGRLVFYHALSKITFRIKKGEGFQTGDPFQFTNAHENIVLKDVPVAGSFNVTEGEFDTTILPTTGTISEFGLNGSDDTYAYILDALLLPGADLSDATLDKIEFTIDNNLYHLSKRTLLKALDGKTLAGGAAALDEGKLRAGVHYIFDMTVGKKKMDSFTASVVPWEMVTAEETKPSNARIVISLEDNGTHMSGSAGFDLYRCPDVSPTIDDDYVGYNWASGYEAPAVLEETEPGLYAATGWYWPSNKTFYHFRAVMPVGHAVSPDATDGDYLTLTGADAYTDVCWGAPYDAATGDLYKAIGPTKGTIHLELMHMMSEVTIALSTSDGDDAVMLSGAHMELSRIYPTGIVRLGDGTVTPTGTPDSVNNTNQVPWTHGFVPQSLDGVVLTITTGDHNQYLVTMKDVLESWAPNHKYSYTFKLTKTGIAGISATLADWVEVTAGDDNVKIQ